MPLTLTEINFRPKRNMPTFPIIPLKKKKKSLSNITLIIKPQLLIL